MSALPAVNEPLQVPAPEVLAQRPVQLQGSAWARRMLQWGGWQLDFDGLPSRQGVLIVYPHTSNWDFIVGVLAKWGMGIQVTLWGKASLFRIPLFGAWLRSMGGVPVDRSSPHGLVGDMVRHFERARNDDSFHWLVLAPEGTRARTESWKSGFYQVAVGAQVPVGLAYLDYGRRRVGVHSYIRLCGDPHADMQEIERCLGPARGCRPENAAPIRLR